MKLKLVKKVEVFSGIWTFEFEPQEALTWVAGQYLRYHIDNPAADDRKVERFFTIAASPLENKVQITTRIDPEKSSTFKKDLLKLEPGSKIEAVGPFGTFTLTDNLNHVFLAGGIGITPYRAILVDLQKSQKPINISLIYASRDQNIVFKEELEQIAASNPNFKIRYVIDPEKITPEVIKQVVEGINEASYYISGPKPMVDAIKGMLEQIGITDDKIKLDFFPGYETI